MTAPAQEILRIVSEVIGGGSRALQVPRFNQEDLESVRRNVLRGLDTQAINEFETELERVCGVEHAVAVSSGTAALHLALLASGIARGHVVLMPSLTFAATANAVIACGAIPFFGDSDPETLGLIDPDRGRFLAVVPVHLLGNPCRTAGLARLGPVIEDAAAALGSALEPECYVRTLSFNLNKIVTTGGGGAVLTNNDALAERVRHLARQAKVPHPYLWQHTEVGFSYRMSPLGAALGIGQLCRLHRTILAKLELYERYVQAFAKCEIADLFVHAAGSNVWLNAIRLKPLYPGFALDVLRALTDEGYGARAMFPPLHTLPPYRGFPRARDLSVAESLAETMICLPSTVARRT